LTFILSFYALFLFFFNDKTFELLRSSKVLSEITASHSRVILKIRNGKAIPEEQTQALPASYGLNFFFSFQNATKRHFENYCGEYSIL